MTSFLHQFPAIFSVLKIREKMYLGISVSLQNPQKGVIVKDNFAGIIDQYPDCPSGVFIGDGEIPGLGVSVWVLSDNPPGSSGPGSPRIRILTDRRECADCTTRGTTSKPPYWIGD